MLPLCFEALDNDAGGKGMMKICSIFIPAFSKFRCWKHAKKEVLTRRALISREVANLTRARTL
jgi:hypothetical protein